jgi:hypothetical protein
VRGNCRFRRWSRRSRCSSQTSGCIARYCGRYLRLHRHGVNCWLYCFGSRRNGRKNLSLDRMFNRFGRFFSYRGRGRRYSGRNCRRFHRNRYGGRRTRHGLRRDKARCWLGRFHGCNWRGSRRYPSRLGNAARRTRGYSRRRCNGLTRRRCRRGGRTRRSSRLGGLLGDRLQYVSRPGDVRQVDLRLELVRMHARAATAGVAGLSVLRVILLHALRFIHFNGAGVRFLFCDPNLE